MSTQDLDDNILVRLISGVLYPVSVSKVLGLDNLLRFFKGIESSLLHSHLGALKDLVEQNATHYNTAGTILNGSMGVSLLQHEA